MLRAYFDGSEADKAFLTLACLAATDEVWADLEAAWEEVRATRGNPRCMHMTDAMSLQGEFEKWSEENRNFLVDGFLNVLLPLRSNARLHSFTCTVDLNAHRRWKDARHHPPPARLCARIVLPHVLDWYLGLDNSILERIDLYFDRNEPFMRHIDADWRSKSIRKRYPAWEWVRTVVPAVACETPALQMADMIAWGRNRLSALGTRSDKPWEIDEFYPTAMRAANTVHGIHRPLNDTALAASTFPEEGFDATNPQRRRQQEDRFLRRAIIKIPPQP